MSQWLKQILNSESDLTGYRSNTCKASMKVKRQN